MHSVPEYRRLFVPGATFFFTLVANFRRPILTTPASLDALRTAFADECRHHPFTTGAIVILPDHLHCIWTLPPCDTRFSMRWSAIKGRFSRLFLAGGGTESGRSASRRKRGERGVWQRRFWEHVIRDVADGDRHLDYIHYNPVKHGYVSCPHAWPHSSFQQWVERGVYPTDWMCRCDGREPSPPRFGNVEDRAGE
jgi:putative transposase